jgi:hypothetical protein
MNKALIMPTTADGWITWLEQTMPNPFTLPEAKRMACAYFAALRFVPGPPPAVVRQLVSEAVKTHPRTSGHRGNYRITPAA